MDTHNGRPKRGASPGKGLPSGVLSVPSSVLPSSSPSSSLKALVSSQSPQISTVSPHLMSPVKEHNGEGETVEKVEWEWKHEKSEKISTAICA